MGGIPILGDILKDVIPGAQAAIDLLEESGVSDAAESYFRDKYLDTGSPDYNSTRTVGINQSDGFDLPTAIALIASGILILKFIGGGKKL